MVMDVDLDKDMVTDQVDAVFSSVRQVPCPGELNCNICSGLFKKMHAMPPFLLWQKKYWSKTPQLSGHSEMNELVNFDHGGSGRIVGHSGIQSYFAVKK